MTDRPLYLDHAATAPLLPAARAADDAASAPPAPTPAEVGRKIYVSSCTRCHGINLATNGIGFDLRTFPQDDKARFVRAVMQGKGAMPARAGNPKLSDDEIAAALDHLLAAVK